MTSNSSTSTVREETRKLLFDFFNNTNDFKPTVSAPPGYRLVDEVHVYYREYIKRALEHFDDIIDPRFINIETGCIDYPAKKSIDEGY